MITRDMRYYSYSTFGADNGYGQPALSNEPVGMIKISVHLLNQATQDNVLYNGATYVGLTMGAVDDSFVIHYKDKNLKVLYVNPYGRYKQVFLAEM